ncbi:MAG: class I SAM-dependent methyltransferase [Elusimicrobiota bacterium]|nr:class I SAM-dependent methyltransferase [Elusimicrobiota bacterium]
MTTLARLETLSAADRFNEEVWKRVEPFLGKDILEVGMGIGIFTEKLLSKGKVFGMEIVPEFVEEARRRLGTRPDLEYLLADIGGPSLPDSLVGRSFDTIVCMNVLEHIKDDRMTLKRFVAMLKPGGRLVLVVPAYQCLFNPLDANDGHFRRYERADLNEKLVTAGLSVVHESRFNLFGIAGWFLNGTLLRRKDLPTGQMGLFNMVAPFLFWLENLIGPPAGLSLLAVGAKR